MVTWVGAMLAFAALTSLVVPATASAATPTETLKAYGDVVLKILEDPALKAPERKQDRRTAVRKVADVRGVRRGLDSVLFNEATAVS